MMSPKRSNWNGNQYLKGAIGCKNANRAFIRSTCQGFESPLKLTVNGMTRSCFCFESNIPIPVPHPRRKYRFLRQSDHSVLAQGETEWVFVDAASGRPRAIPQPIKALFRVVPGDPETRTSR